MTSAGEEQVSAAEVATTEGEQESGILGTTPGPASGNPESGLRRGRRGSGGPHKALLVLGVVAVVMVAVLTISYLRGTKTDVPTSARAVSVGIDNRGVTADEDLSQRYEEMVIAENVAATDAATRGAGSGVVVPPLIGERVVEQPAVVDMTPYEPDRSAYGGNQRQSAQSASNADRIRAIQEALAAQRARWRTASTHGFLSVASAPDPVPLAPAGGATGSGLGFDVPLFVPVSGVVEVGANTDYPAEVIVRITAGPLRGARAVGMMTSSPRGNVHDRLQLRFTRVEHEGVLYRTDSIAVDPSTRLPALKGNINRHLIYNTASQAGASFLLGFGAALTSGGRVSVGDPTGSVFLPTQTLRDTLYAESARELAGALRQGSPRLPTITLPMGAALSIVFVEPLVNEASGPSIASNAATSRRPTSPGRDAEPTLSRPPSSTRMPDGTELIFEPITWDSDP